MCHARLFSGIVPFRSSGKALYLFLESENREPLDYPKPPSEGATTRRECLESATPRSSHFRTLQIKKNAQPPRSARFLYVMRDALICSVSPFHPQLCLIKKTLILAEDYKTLESSQFLFSMSDELIVLGRSFYTRVPIGQKRLIYRDEHIN